MTAKAGREYWVDDKYATRCYKCGSKFSFLWRKHHCRQCGQIYCSNCLTVSPKDTKICLDCSESMKAKSIPQNHNRSSRMSVNLESSLIISRSFSSEKSPDNTSTLQPKTGNVSGTWPTVGDDSHVISSQPSKRILNEPSVTSNVPKSKATSIKYQSNIPNTPQNDLNDKAALRVRVYKEGTLAACPKHQESDKEAELVVYGMYDTPVPTLENPMTLWLEKLTSRARNHASKSPSVLQKHDANVDTMDIERKTSYQPFPFVNFRLYETHQNAKFFPTSFVCDEIVFSESVEKVFAAEYSEILQALRQRQSVAQNQLKQRNLVDDHCGGTNVNTRIGIPTTATTHSSVVDHEVLKSQSHLLDYHKETERSSKNRRLCTFLDIPPHHSTRIDIILESLQMRCSAHLKRRVQILLQELLRDNPGIIYPPGHKDTCEHARDTLRGSPIASGGNSGSRSMPSFKSDDLNDDVIAKEEFVLEWTDILCDLTWKLIGQTQFVPRNFLPHHFFVHVSTEDMPHALVYNGIQRHIGQFYIPGGCISDSQILPGVSFIHSVTRKSTSKSHRDPKVLLLGGHVGRSPMLGHTDLFEYCENYEGWLDKLYSRIRTWNPTIILVEETMHHYMQTKVHRDNIVLVTTVKREILEHLERALHGRIVDDLAKANIADMANKRMNPCGMCENFTIEEFPDIEHFISFPCCSSQEETSNAFSQGYKSDLFTSQSTLYPCVPTRTITVLSFTGLPHPTFSTLILRGAHSNILKEMISLLQNNIIIHARHLLNLTHFLIDCCSFVGSEEAASKLLGVNVSITGNHYTVMEIPSLCPRGGYIAPAALKEDVYNSTMIETFTAITNTTHKNKQQQQKIVPSLCPRHHIEGEMHEEELEGVKTAKIVSMLVNDVDNVNHVVISSVSQGNSIDSSVVSEVPLASSESLTVNFGIDFSAEALACAKQYPNDVHKFRDEIEVNIVTIKSEVNQNDDSSIVRSYSPKKSKTARPSRKVSMLNENNLNKEESNYPFLFAVFDDGGDFMDYDLRKEYNRERRQYEFYKVKGGDETIQEFLQDIADSEGDFTKLILHENRKIVIRCVHESVDSNQSDASFDLAQTDNSSAYSDTPIVCYTACLLCNMRLDGSKGMCPSPVCSSEATTSERGQDVDKEGYNDVRHDSKLGGLSIPETPNLCSSANTVLEGNLYTVPTCTYKMPAVSERKEVSCHTLSLSLGAFFELMLYVNQTSGIIKPTSATTSRVGFFSSLCGHPLFTSVRPCFEVYSSDGKSLATITFAVEPLGVHVLEAPPMFMTRSPHNITEMPYVSPICSQHPTDKDEIPPSVRQIFQHRNSTTSVNNCITSYLMPQNNHFLNIVNTSLMSMTLLNMCSYSTSEMFVNDTPQWRLNPKLDLKSIPEASSQDKQFAYTMAQYWNNHPVKSNESQGELTPINDNNNNVDFSVSASCSTEDNTSIRGIEAMLKFAIKQSNDYRNSIREQYFQLELLELKHNVIYLIMCMQSMGYSQYYLLPRQRTEVTNDALTNLLNTEVSVMKPFESPSLSSVTSPVITEISDLIHIERQNTARPRVTDDSPLEGPLGTTEALHISSSAIDLACSTEASSELSSNGGSTASLYNSSGRISPISPLSPTKYSCDTSRYFSGDICWNNESEGSQFQNQNKIKSDTRGSGTPATIALCSVTSGTSKTEPIYITPKKLYAMLSNVTTLEQVTLLRSHILAPCLREVVHHYYNTVQRFISSKNRLTDGEQGTEILENGGTVSISMVSPEFPRAFVYPSIEGQNSGDNGRFNDNYNVDTEIDLDKLMSSSLAYSPKHDTYVRLEEPTSLILLAIRSTMTKKIESQNIYSATNSNTPDYGANLQTANVRNKKTSFFDPNAEEVLVENNGCSSRITLLDVRKCDSPSSNSDEDTAMGNVPRVVNVGDLKMDNELTIMELSQSRRRGYNTNTDTNNTGETTDQFSTTLSLVSSVSADKVIKPKQEAISRNNNVLPTLTTSQRPIQSNSSSVYSSAQSITKKSGISERREKANVTMYDPFAINSYDHAIDVLFKKNLYDDRQSVFSDAVYVNDDSVVKTLRDAALSSSNSSGKQSLMKLRANVRTPVRSNVINSKSATRTTSPVKPTTASANNTVTITLNIHRKLNVTVELLYPHQFAALRYIHSGGCPEDILVSLLRCKDFTPSSGKSNKHGKSFYKTMDERYILKEVKQTELKHFEAFGMSYFHHMGVAFTEEKACCDDYAAALTGKVRGYPVAQNLNTNVNGYPENHSAPGTIRTLIVKTLGVYSVNINDPTKKGKRKGSKFFILMTNVSSNRHIQRSFDLKGSQVNRTAPYIRSAVYMDTNMCARMKNGYFFYVKEEEKRLIKRIAEKDSHVLSDENIMDYSIIVAVENSRLENQLSAIEELSLNSLTNINNVNMSLGTSSLPCDDIAVRQPYNGTSLLNMLLEAPVYSQLPILTFGIIDYIHPFNLTKLMESQLKQRLNQFTGFELPTILEPHEYKQRFDRYTDQYFCGVPSKLSTYNRTRAFRHTSVLSPHYNTLYSSYIHGSASIYGAYQQPHVSSLQKCDVTVPSSRCDVHVNDNVDGLAAKEDVSVNVEH